MRIKHIFLLLPVTTIAALILISCGSNDSCDAPLTITPGTWCITIQTTQHNCGLIKIDTTPYTANFVQNENYLSATSGDYTYAGTICGNNAIMTGLNGTTTTSMDIVFSNASSATGSVDWDTGTCNGTDTFTAVAGTGDCPPL